MCPDQTVQVDNDLFNQLEKMKRTLRLFVPEANIAG
jgi:hypothetical protein